MEKEKLQSENALKESPRKSDDTEEYKSLITEWHRPDNKRQEADSLKNYERKGERLSEELTRLLTIITEKRVKIQYTMELIQETEDELRLGLIQLRAYLRKAANHIITDEEKADWEREEYRLKAQLTELEMWLGLQGSECRVEAAPVIKEAQKSEELSDKEAQESGLLIKALKMMSLLRRDHANKDKVVLGKINKNPLKTPLKCFYCHEEGHFKRNCSKRPPPNWTRSRGGWNQRRGGQHMIRSEPSWYRGGPIRGRGGYQVRRPRGQPDEIDEELQQPPYEYEGNERHLAGSREHNESLRNRNKSENERVRDNPLTSTKLSKRFYNYYVI